jgi:prephenate dehydrogenase
MSADASLSTRGPVLVVGAGLVGTSIGLSLATRGVEVLLSDSSPTTLALAREVGAGRAVTPQDVPTLVVVSAPPDVCARLVVEQLAAYPGAIVTDVASVKASIARSVLGAVEDATRYVGSHPMAGSERSGPTAARADLFAGRPWVIAATERSAPAAVRVVRDLAVDLGATPVEMDATGHDDAVALVSHMPQIVASLVAARLRDAPEAALALSGQGLRDVTRIAASDPQLWAAILGANATHVRAVLAAVRGDLDVVLAGFDRVVDGGDHGGLAKVAQAIEAGNAGVARIPGKHGGAHREYAVVAVLVPDAPGELARLLADVGRAGVNLEDLRMEHVAGHPVGLVELSVLPKAREQLESALDAAGWKVAG